LQEGHAGVCGQPALALQDSLLVQLQQQQHKAPKHKATHKKT
jgi:hypothetical protein